MLAFTTGLDAEGNPFLVLPNQPPGTITVSVKNGTSRPWPGGKKQAATQAVEMGDADFKLVSLEDISKHLELQLAQHLRITLPRPGQTLQEQPLHQAMAWPTLQISST